jgi:hypothetical protein
MTTLAHLHSYPSIYALGHKAITELFNGPVLVEEKIDGSQFSFARVNGELLCRSKGKDIITSAPEKMFAKAVQTAGSLDLRDGWVYRAEFLQSPKHNSLTYSRVPKDNLILFDVSPSVESYLSYADKTIEAARIGMEIVPLLHDGVVPSLDFFRTFLERDSVLGGCKVEGVVVKNYAVFTAEKKVAMGKYVSEAFKELHGVEWKKSNPTQTDVVQLLLAELKTPARWQKAIQHLRDAGQLEGSPRDIGPLIKEIPDDIRKEAEDTIKQRLFDHFWPQLRRGVTAGFPEFYKEQLAASVFTHTPTAAASSPPSHPQIESGR